MTTSSRSRHEAKAFAVPPAVRDAAKWAEHLRAHYGYAGGTATGFGRARQLATKSHVDAATIRTMRNWFARHGPSASNGGTSYPGYVRFVQALQNKRVAELRQRSKWRGALAWLLWGGDAGLAWIQSVYKSSHSAPATPTSTSSSSSTRSNRAFLSATVPVLNTKRARAFMDRLLDD